MRGPDTGRRRSVTRNLVSSRSGLVAEGVKFGLAGSLVAIVYMGVTTLLADAVEIRFQVALAIGFGTAIIVHFTLQRTFVWVHRGEFALNFRGQFVRYAAMSIAQYGTAAAITSTVPSALDVSTTIIYIAWTVLSSVVSFFVLGRGIFHRSTKSTTARL